MTSGDGFSEAVAQERHVVVDAVPAATTDGTASTAGASTDGTATVTSAQAATERSPASALGQRVASEPCAIRT